MIHRSIRLPGRLKPAVGKVLPDTSSHILGDIVDRNPWLSVLPRIWLGPSDRWKAGGPQKIPRGLILFP